MIQIKVLAAGKVIADAEMDRTVVDDTRKLADYEGWLVDANPNGNGGRRREFTAHGIGRGRGTWHTVLQLLLEAHRQELSPAELQELVRGPRLCRARRHPWAPGKCEGCRQDRVVDAERLRAAARVAKEKERAHKRIDALERRLEAEQQRLEALPVVLPPAPRSERNYTVSQAVIDARKANLEKARAARAARRTAGAVAG